jgi:purine-binding chemotaxis protein CheW
MQYLTFRLNGVEYAVDVGIIETVVEHGDTTVVPTPVEYMKGVMDLRGRVIPVIDLRKKFGLPERAKGDSGTIVIVFAVEDGEKRLLTVGALVDEVSEVLTIEEGELEAARADGVALWEGYVRGVVRLADRMIVVIEADGLFSLRELEALRAA